MGNKPLIAVCRGCGQDVDMNVEVNIDADRYRLVIVGGQYPVCEYMGTFHNRECVAEFMRRNYDNPDPWQWDYVPRPNR